MCKKCGGLHKRGDPADVDVIAATRLCLCPVHLLQGCALLRVVIALVNLMIRRVCLPHRIVLGHPPAVCPLSVARLRFLGVRGRGHLLTYVRLPFGPISLALMKRSSSFVRVTLDISSAFCSNACSVEVDAAKNRDDSVRSTPDRAPLHVRLEVFERVRLMFDMMKPPEKLYDEFADKCRVFNAKRPVEQQLNDASFIAETATC